MCRFLGFFIKNGGLGTKRVLSMVYEIDRRECIIYDRRIITGIYERLEKDVDVYRNEFKIVK